MSAADPISFVPCSDDVGAGHRNRQKPVLISSAVTLIKSFSLPAKPCRHVAIRENQVLVQRCLKAHLADTPPRTTVRISTQHLRSKEQAVTRSHSPAHFDASGDERHRRIVDAVHDHGWSEQDNFLPPDLTLALALECAALAAAGMLTLARVSQGAASSLQPDVRGDRIQWLESGQSEACDRYLAIVETLRIALNRGLFLGLDEYESHFAFYAPGASYRQHRDRFRHDDSRTVSVIVYLNRDWLPEHGGALRLHPEGLSTQDISPVGSRLVVFLSADMLHEVLPATRDRLSLTGWFRRRS
ncbi:2OG-Fe(II) oxygenase [Paraburkholderia sp. GAS334]|uniref:2OG-Fe(II) oxygenase n=1 Tax=Paraburkholderia sp. GAS334 TaxID=3035131 RepID=UPI003D205C24